MADIVMVTQKPVRETGPNKKQDLRLAVDVSTWDELDLLLTCYENTGGGTITVNLLTGMQMESETGWISAGAFPATAANAANKANFKNLLRYVRYELVGSTTATFLVNGVGRKWA
jgi:hypothetical protein